MADERDPDISRKYRELGAEEPPRALDEAILAASRRAVDSHPASLVAPAGRRRWYFPVAAAAIITLAVAVTVQVERQKPDDEFVVATAPSQEQKEERAASQVEKKERAFSAPAVEQPKAAQERMRTPQSFTPEPPPATPAPAPQATAPPASADSLRELAKSTDSAAARGDARSRESVTTGGRSLDTPAREAAPATAPELARGAPDSRVRAQIQPKAEQPAAQAAETRRMEAELQVKPAASAPAPVAQAAKPAPERNIGAAGAILSYAYVSPEKALEQIAELRKQGRHEEADKVLAEFRLRYPDYRLTDEMRAKVERKK